MAATILTKQRHRIETIGLVWVLAGFIFAHLLPIVGFVLPWRISTALVIEHSSLFYAGILFYRIWKDRFTWQRAGAIALCLALRIGFASPVIATIECAIFVTFALCVGGKLSVLGVRAFLFLGAISYSLYVVHQPLGFRLQLGFHALGAGPWLNMIATLCVLVAISTVLTYVVERPGARLIRRICATRRHVGAGIGAT